MRTMMLTMTAAILVVAGNASAAEKPLSGAELLDVRCSVCHAAERPKGAKKTRTQWEETVTRMMGKGAALTAAEKKILIDHLAKTYKP